MASPTIPLHRQLRNHTAAAHARLDAALGGALLTAADYVAYARGMAAFLAGAAAVLGGAHPLLSRAHAALSSDIGAPLPGFEGEAHPDLAQRIGWEYVVSGSTLGAQLLLRDVRGRDYGNQVATEFLATYAGSDAWLPFLRALEQVKLDGAARLRACRAALDAFHCAEDALIRNRIPA
jgi:heme oxygenase